MTKRTLWMYAGAVLAIALFSFGCGGDDNGGLSAEDMARITTAESNAAAAVAAQATAEAEATAAMAAQAMAESEAADAMAAQMAAEAAQATAMAEAATAMAAQTAAEGDAADAAIAQAAAEAAQSAAEAATAAAMAAQTAAENAQATAEAAQMAAETALAEANMRIAELEAEAMAGPGTVGTAEGGEGRAAATRIMNSVMMSDDVEDNPMTESIDESMDGMYMINSGASIKTLEQARLGQDPELTIELATGATLDSATDSADMDAPDVGSDWSGVALEKMGAGNITQTALVYSDAERSVRAFGDTYPYNRSVIAAGLTNAGAATVDAALTPSHRMVINVRSVADDVDTADNETYVSVQDPRISLNHGLSAATGVTSRMFEAMADTDTTPHSVGGSYDGVPGVFTFADATDPVAAPNAVFNLSLVTSGDDAGELILTQAEAGTPGTIANADGVLLFRANNAEALLPDKDYLAFGVWAVVPDSPTQANPGEVGAFVKASAAAFDSQELNGLTGSASYTGPAAGHYATRDAGSYMVEEGRFTATATISASFSRAGSSRPTAAVSEAVTGADPMRAVARASYGTTPGVSFSESMIHDFMDEDGNMMAGWVVNLDGPDMINNMAGTATATVGVTIDPATTSAVADLAAAHMAARTLAVRAAKDGTMLSGTTDGTTGALAWTGVWDGSFHGTNMSALPTGIVGRFQADAGTPTPLHNADGEINLFLDQGFAGVVGSFAGR